MAGHDGHRGWLYYVGCDPAARLDGLGRKMVTAAEAWLADKGITKVQLLVRPGNAAVASFYARLGYAETPIILMAKWLKQPKQAD